MSTLKHIERIGDTESNIRTNLDLLQIATLTDQNEELVWTNDDASKLKYAAIQKYWNGAAIVYENNDFGQITLHDDLIVDEYIKRSGGTDDRIRFEDDTITFTLTGVDVLILTSSGVTFGALVIDDGANTTFRFAPDGSVLRLYKSTQPITTWTDTGWFQG